jgi:translation initiation factor IF-3
VSVPEALRIAGEEGFDLVEVAPSAEPPVCKIMDYGKFKYEASKKVHDARKRSRTVQMKEIKVRPRTDDHDLEFKIRNLKKFLEKNNRVKVTLTFRAFSGSQVRWPRRARSSNRQLLRQGTACPW